MALHIQNPEVDEMVRELTLVTGESITHAVSVAVRERLKRVKAAGLDPTLRADIDAMIERVAKLPLLDDRSDEEILGYNEHGHFD